MSQLPLPSSQNIPSSSRKRQIEAPSEPPEDPLKVRVIQLAGIDQNQFDKERAARSSLEKQMTVLLKENQALASETEQTKKQIVELTDEIDQWEVTSAIQEETLMTLKEELRNILKENAGAFGEQDVFDAQGTSHQTDIHGLSIHEIRQQVVHMNKRKTEWKAALDELRVQQEQMSNEREKALGERDEALRVSSELSEASRRAIEQKETALQQTFHERDEASHRVTEVTRILEQKEADLRKISVERAEAVREKNETLEKWRQVQVNTADIVSQTNAAADELRRQQEMLKQMRDEIAQQQRAITDMQNQRDQALHDKITLESEVYHLQARVRAASQKGKTRQPHTRTTDHDGDADMDADDEDETGAPNRRSSTTATPSNDDTLGSNPTESTTTKSSSDSATSANSASSGTGKPSSGASSSSIDVAAIVSETLRQLNQVPISTSQKHKEGSVAYVKQIKKAGLSALPKKLEKNWRSHIRTCFCKATGSTLVNAFQNYHPIEKTIADEFAIGTGSGPEGDSEYRLYFGDEWRKAKWNRIVVRNMISFIGSQKEQAHISGDLSSEVIEACVWDLVAQARSSWRARLPRPHVAESRWETPVEACTRAEEYESRREMELRLNSRKRSKYVERKDGVTRLIKAATSSMDTRKWTMVQNVLLKCGIEAQSSDNTDADDEVNSPPALHTAVPHYRRRILGVVFEDLDTKIKELNRRVARDTGKRIIPKASRIRIRSGIRTKRTIACKLPESCYHARFVQSLDALALENLGVKRVEIELFDKWASAQGDSDSMEEA